MVVVILAILAGMTLPKFYPNKEKAYAAEALQILSSIRRAEEAYKLENGSYLNQAGTQLSAAEWARLGMESPDTTEWDFLVSGDIASAARNASDVDYDNTLISLKLASGAYCGDHPYVKSLPNSTTSCS